MFDSYISGLRLQQCRPADLDPRAFHHVQTIFAPEPALAPRSGWAIWLAGSDTNSRVVAWPWGLIQNDLVAIDTMRVQSNLSLLDDANRPLGKYRTLAFVVELINRFDWQVHARECGRGRI